MRDFILGTFLAAAGLSSLWVALAKWSKGDPPTDDLDWYVGGRWLGLILLLGALMLVAGIVLMHQGWSAAF